MSTRAIISAMMPTAGTVTLRGAFRVRQDAVEKTLARTLGGEFNSDPGTPI